MTIEQSSVLRLPSFLHGTYAFVHQKTRREGHRCSEQYRKSGTFPSPQQMLEIPSGELVLTHGVADFQHERPAWRLYMVSDVMSGLWEALDWQDTFAVGDAYEAFFRETAWGALYFATAQMSPVSAERTALRLQAVLRAWEPLQSVRYLFKTLGATLTLEELMAVSCGWAINAWSPAGDASVSVRTRLQTAVERMARATREDCIEAILRRMPLALSSERSLKHWQVLSNPALQRERLAALDPEEFERVSGARTSDLIGYLHDWDHELGMN
jgi:hypothetical protein